jgi:hypothetical protein
MERNIIHEEGYEEAIHFHMCKQQQEQRINKFLDLERFTNYTVMYMSMWNIVSCHIHMLFYEVLPLIGNV